MRWILCTIVATFYQLSSHRRRYELCRRITVTACLKSFFHISTFLLRPQLLKRRGNLPLELIKTYRRDFTRFSWNLLSYTVMCEIPINWFSISSWTLQVMHVLSFSGSLTAVAPFYLHYSPRNGEPDQETFLIQRRASYQIGEYQNQILPTAEMRGKVEMFC